MRALNKDLLQEGVTGILCGTLVALAISIYSYDANAKEDISVPQAYMLGQCEVLATVAVEDGVMDEKDSTQIFINTLKTTAEINGVTERQLVEYCELLMKEYSNEQ